MAQRQLISLISPCFNEEGNIDELYRRASLVMAGLPQYDFEYLFIDNASTDGTVDKLRASRGGIRACGSSSTPEILATFARLTGASCKPVAMLPWAWPRTSKTRRS